MRTHSGALGVALVVALTGCGGELDGPTAEEKAAVASSQAAASASEASASAEASRSAEQQAEFDSCSTTTADLVTALNDLNSRLSVGLNYRDYGEKVGDVQVEYDAVIDQVIEIGGDCLSLVAIPLENATNRYLKVKNLWSDCIADYDCDFSEGETNDKVQKHWAAATELIDRAETNLAGLRPAE